MNTQFFTCIVTFTSDFYLSCEFGLHIVLFFQLKGLLSLHVLVCLIIFHRSVGPLREALTLLKANKRITSHGTGDLANETAIWASISCHIFLEIWKADTCLRKTRRTPVIYSSLVKHEARKWKSGHTCKLSDYWMCLNLIHRSRWESKSFTDSNCLSTTSDQLLVKQVILTISYLKYLIVIFFSKFFFMYVP